MVSSTGFSRMAEFRLRQARMLPRFLPVRTSRREAQQQHMPSWMMNAMMEAPAAIHMSVKSVSTESRVGCY